MKTKKIIALLIALVFTFGLIGISFAEGLVGTITKIEGDKITIRDNAGKLTTVVVTNATKLKIGNKVKIIDIPDIKGKVKAQIIDVDI
jgi:hypothetical protein